MASCGDQEVIRNGVWWTNEKENIFIFVVSTVSADGLAPLGARTSAGTVMTRSYTYMGLALDWPNTVQRHNLGQFSWKSFQ